MSGMKDTLADTPYPTPARSFDGSTYHAPRDYARLHGQLKDVFNLMQDGNWRTLDVISKHVGGSGPAVSARLRDLRKTKYGSHSVEREYLGNGTWQYRVKS